MEEILKELQRHNQNTSEWIGRILGKIDKAQERQEHFMIGVMSLQIVTITLITVVLIMLR